MKNKIFSFFSVFIALNLYAQVPRGFSFAAGMNQTSIKSQDLIADPGIGFGAGIGFNFGYHETYNYEINMSFNHSTLGLKSVDSNGMNLATTKAARETFDFSAQFNYYVIKPDEDKFYAGVLVGANLAFGGSALTVKSDNGDQNYLPYMIKGSELTNLPTISYGALFGVVAGYNQFRLGVKYNLGLDNVLSEVHTNDYDESNTYRGPSLSGKLNSVSVVLYYKFYKF